MALHCSEKGFKDRVEKRKRKAIPRFEIQIVGGSTREKWSGEHQLNTDRIGVGRRLADYKEILRRKVRMPADCSDGKERSQAEMQYILVIKFLCDIHIQFTTILVRPDMRHSTTMLRQERIRCSVCKELT